MALMAGSWGTADDVKIVSFRETIEIEGPDIRFRILTD
jgi:hypothetical protein